MLFVKDGGLRTATVVAENDIEVLVLNKIDMDALIKSGDLGPNCIAELENLAKARRMENNTHSKGTWDVHVVLLVERIISQDYLLLFFTCTAVGNEK